MAWLPVFLPLVAAAVTATAGRRPRLCGAVAVGGLLLTLASAIPLALAGGAARWRWGGPLQLTLSVEGVARPMVALVPAVAAPVTAFAASGREEPGLPRLLALLVGFVGAMELLVAAGDFLALLAGWELVAACSWALIAHRWGEEEPPRAAGRAFVVVRAGGVGLILAAGAALASARTLSFSGLGRVDGTALDVVAAGILVAAAAKSAQVPFSPWLFDAMAGPTPVSALLHSVAMVAAGAYVLARLGPALALTGWFGPAAAALGLVGALAGGVVALVQTDLKRSLAASTTAQFGLALVAVGAGSGSAALFQVLAHALSKALLFLAAGVAVGAAGTGRLGERRLGPQGRSTAVLFGVGALGLAGVPPLGGALAKEQLLAAAGALGSWGAAGVVVAGFLTALYAARLFLLAFGGPGERPGPDPTPAERWSMAALAGASLALGVVTLSPAGRALGAVAGGLPRSASGWGWAGSLLTAGAGFLLAGWLGRRGRLVRLGLPSRLHRALEDWLALPAAGRALVVGPVLALSRALARGDDRVVDAGVRGTARLGEAVSGLLARWAERGVDGVVEALAGLGLTGARGSRRADERVVDGAVEGVARGVGAAGSRARRLQTGLTHHYYLLVAVGVAAVVAAAVVAR